MSHMRLSLLLVIIVGCSSAEDRSSPILSDSLGVTLIDYAGSFAASRARSWSVAAEPTLTIVQTDPAFYRVGAALFQSDGRIVVANGGSYQLLLFERAGQPHATSGGKGGGPGQFHQLTFVSVGRGDSVFAYDTRERRVSVFDKNGTFARAVTLRGLDTLGIAEQVSVLRNGEFATAFGLRTRGNCLVRDSLVVITFTPSGEPVASLGIFPHGLRTGVRTATPAVAGPLSFLLPLPFPPNRHSVWLTPSCTSLCLILMP